jgi:hypothetical protein
MVIRIPSIMYGITNAQEKATGEKDPSLTLGMTRQIRGDKVGSGDLPVQITAAYLH